MEPSLLQAKGASQKNGAAKRGPKAAPHEVKKENGEDEEAEDVKPAVRPHADDMLGKPISIRHNNQTGKWLTLFRARFNANPAVESHFSVRIRDDAYAREQGDAAF